jgi:hypothetical protein
MHDAAEVVRLSLEEECDNVCRLSAYFGNVVLTHWQAAVLYARAYPHTAHVMVCALPPLLVCLPGLSCCLCSAGHECEGDLDARRVL